MLFGTRMLFVLLFLLLGLVFSCGKGAWLIAGYNTSPPEEKAKYDEKALCRWMGKFMFAMAGCWLIIALGDLFGIKALTWIGGGIFVALIFGGPIYANTGGRFRK